MCADTNTGQPADLAWGAFADEAPWVLEREEIAWWTDAERARAAARARVPTLIEPHRLPPGRRGMRVLGRLLLAVVPWMWRRRRGRAPGDRGIAELSWRLRRAAEDLGPTFIKL